MRYPKLTAIMAIMLSICMVSVALPQKYEISFESSASVISDDVENQTNDNVPAVVSYVFLIVIFVLITALLLVLLGLANKIKRGS